MKLNVYIERLVLASDRPVSRKRIEDAIHRELHQQLEPAIRASALRTSSANVDRASAESPQQNGHAGSVAAGIYRSLVP